MPKIGIQLHTIREEIEKNPSEALGNIASIGFKGVEFAFDYGGMEPDELSVLLNETRLECIGIYVKNISELEDPGSPAYRYAAALKCPYVTVGMTGKVNSKEWAGAIEALKKAADLSASRGITLLYHNHWQEFGRIEGKYALDILFERTDPCKVKAELDTGWITKAGEDPVEYIRKYSGRLPCLHVRDFSPEYEVAEIGEGIIDFPKVIGAAEGAAVEWLVFEQSVGTFESAAASYRRLSELKTEQDKRS